MTLKVASAVLFWCGAFTLAAAGQEKALSKAEFETVRAKGYSLLEKNAYRANFVFKRFQTGSNPIERESSQIVEFQPPDRRRAVTILKTENGSTRFETIEVGSRKFTRSGMGQWAEEKTGNDRFTIKREAVAVSESFRLLGSTKLAGVNMLIYESTLSSEHRTDIGTVVRSSVETYWINRSGRFAKRMLKDMENGELTMSTVAEYEYGSKIEIVAPIK